MNPANYLIPMLELYCAWLNRWALAQDGIEPYTIHAFMITDRERDLWGDARVCGVVPHILGDDFMVIALVSDGDEGGPHELTAWFDIGPDNTTTISSMAQGFDTERQFIYQNRTFIHLPEGDQR